jgi:hypothetical protein
LEARFEALGLVVERDPLLARDRPDGDLGEGIV